jgi:hypothetical protein
MIRDSSYIWTGSANFTKGDLSYKTIIVLFSTQKSLLQHIPLEVHDTKVITLPYATILCPTVTSKIIRTSRFQTNL